MSLLILTHILIGFIGVFVGVLIAGKKRDHGDIHQADNDERLADFYTARISKVDPMSPTLKNHRASDDVPRARWLRSGLRR